MRTPNPCNKLRRFAALAVGPVWVERCDIIYLLPIFSGTGTLSGDPSILDPTNSGLSPIAGICILDYFTYNDRLLLLKIYGMPAT